MSDERKAKLGLGHMATHEILENGKPVDKPAKGKSYEVRTRKGVRVVGKREAVLRDIQAAYPDSKFSWVKE